MCETKIEKFENNLLAAVSNYYCCNLLQHLQQVATNNNYNFYWYYNSYYKWKTIQTVQKWYMCFEYCIKLFNLIVQSLKIWLNCFPSVLSATVFNIFYTLLKKNCTPLYDLMHMGMQSASIIFVSYHKILFNFFRLRKNKL